MTCTARWAVALATWLVCGLLAAGPALAQTGLRASTAAEKALDEQAFAGMATALADRLTDVQSAVVLIHGRVAYEFYRDGEPDRLRNVQSIEKSALSALVGVALAQGHLAGMDQPVLQLMPQWAPLQPDPRAAAITLRHLLTMTAGFEVNDPRGSARWLRPTDAWARPMAAAPGAKFAYDNAHVLMISAILEKAGGMPLAAYARKHLGGPVGMAEPSYERSLHLRTIDMAKLGQLFLNNGVWAGQQLVPVSYVSEATLPQTSGGAPVSLPYGYLWWAVPPEGTARNFFMASGYGGQLIWVYPPLGLVAAVTSTVSPDSQQRGHAGRLVRGGLVSTVQRRLEMAPR